MARVLIKNSPAIATMNERREVLRGSDVLIEDNIIERIGVVPHSIHADTVIDASGMVVVPGLVNTHHHLYQTLTRCIPQVESAPLFDWLTYLYDVWGKVTPEWIRASTLVGAAELLLTGCTTTADQFYIFPKSAPRDLIDHEIDAAREIGIRFHPCRGSMSQGRSQGGLPPDELVQTEKEILDDCARLIDTYHDPSDFSMCRIALGPCSPFSVTAELLKGAMSLARARGVMCHTHVAETIDEEKYCLERFRMRPLEYLESVGWLGTDVWLAHCVHLDEREVQLLARTGTGVAHCPTSNMRLGSGIAPVRAMLDRGVRVGLAVDGSASNDTSDMLGEVRQALLGQRLRGGAAALSPMEALWMATRGGALVLGRDDIGSIEVGKAADLAIFDLNRVDFAGAHDRVSALILCGMSHVANTVIVNGKVVVDGGKLATLDEQRLLESAKLLPQT